MILTETQKAWRKMEIEELIEEHRVAASNERLWSKGANTPEQAANRFALKEGGNIYTRLTNPTTQAFEKRMAAIEGGTAAYATASGMAAIFYAIINLTQVGDNIVSADNLYGGTYELFENTLEELGRSVTFVDSQSPDEFEAAIDDKTRAIYVESIGNPKLDIPDFDKISEIAHSHGIPLIAGTDTHALNKTHLVGREILQKAKDVNFESESNFDLTFKNYSFNLEFYLIFLLLLYYNGLPHFLYY